MSDQLVTETASYTTHNNYALRGIRTRDPSNRAAADLSLRPHGHRDRLNDHSYTQSGLKLEFIMIREKVRFSGIKDDVASVIERQIRGNISDGSQ
jgi:hypothetical protein